MCGGASRRARSSAAEEGDVNVRIGRADFEVIIEATPHGMCPLLRPSPWHQRAPLSLEVFMLVLARICSLAFVGPSVRLSAPSRPGSADAVMLFGRADGASKVSSPREDGTQPPPPSLHRRPGCHRRRRPLPRRPLTNHHCRVDSLGSNMPNPMRSVQNGKDDFQARRAPRG